MSEIRPSGMPQGAATAVIACHDLGKTYAEGRLRTPVFAIAAER